MAVASLRGISRMDQAPKAFMNPGTTDGFCASMAWMPMAATWGLVIIMLFWYFVVFCPAT